MPRLMRVCIGVLIAALGGWLMGGCGGDSEVGSPPTATVKVMLVDAPAADLEEVHVALESIELIRRADVPQMLLTRLQLPADIDLLALDDPLVLGTVEVLVARYTAIRVLINGASSANRVVTADGRSHPLRLVDDHPESQVGLVLPFRLTAGTEGTLLLDFCAGASVYRFGVTNEWRLRPVIFAQYVEGTPQFGSISGTVVEANGDSLAMPVGTVLGAFLRSNDHGQPVAVAEVCPDTGQFSFGRTLPGRYVLTIQRANRDWTLSGEPLPLVGLGGTSHLLRLPVDQTLRPVYTIDL